MMYSSDEIWRGENQERSITQDLDQIETDIDNLEIGKAPANHTHTEYAPTIHEHSQYAQANHTHAEYAAADHEHTGYAASSHSHAQGDVTGLIQALAAKAEATHDHTLSEVVGLIAALAAKADLVDGKVPSSQLPSFVDDVLEYATVSKFPTTGESGKIYVATSTNKTYRWSGSAYVEVAGGIALGETASTAYRGDRGKTAYDHSQNGTVHVTAAQKTAWDGKAAGDHTHTPASIGAAPASHTHDYAAPDHTHTPASIGAAPASHTHDYAAKNHTHTPSSIGAAPAEHSHDQYATLSKVYPIGSIYLTTSSVNPSTLFGGTWEAFGTGRVLMGVPSGRAAGATGGNNSVTIPAHKHTTQGHVLTVNEIPAHHHACLNYNVNGNTSYTFTKNSIQAMEKKGFDGNVKTTYVGGGQSHTHGDTGTVAAQTISVVQPYITCYMWKRTA